MKTLSIATVAWSAAVRTFADGNIFRESNCDLMVQDICDRLGYLKNALDGKARLAGDNALTGFQTLTGASAGISLDSATAGITTNTLSVNGNSFFANAGALGMNGTLNMTAVSGFCPVPNYLPDSSATISAGGIHARVPTLTANRVYTLPTSTNSYRLIHVVRTRTADAFTVTIQRPGAATVGVIPASQAGWITFIDRDQGGGSLWVPYAWSSNITSLDTTV